MLSLNIPSTPKPSPWKESQMMGTATVSSSVKSTPVKESGNVYVPNPSPFKDMLANMKSPRSIGKSPRKESPFKPIQSNTSYNMDSSSETFVGFKKPTTAPLIKATNDISDNQRSLSKPSPVKVSPVKMTQHHPDEFELSMSPDSFLSTQKREAALQRILGSESPASDNGNPVSSGGSYFISPNTAMNEGKREKILADLLRSPSPTKSAFPMALNKASDAPSVASGTLKENPMVPKSSFGDNSKSSNPTKPADPNLKESCSKKPRPSTSNSESRFFLKSPEAMKDAGGSINVSSSFFSPPEAGNDAGGSNIKSSFFKSPEAGKDSSFFKSTEAGKDAGNFGFSGMFGDSQGEATSPGGFSFFGDDKGNDGSVDNGDAFSFNFGGSPDQGSKSGGFGGSFF